MDPGDVDHRSWLRDREKLNRQIVELVAEGVWAIDEQLITSYVSDSMADMLGYEPSEMVGRSLFEFMDSEGRAQVERRILLDPDDRENAQTFKLNHRDGRTVWARASTEDLIHGDEFRGTVAVLTDVTYEYEARSRVEHDRLQEQALLAAIPDLMFRWDRDGTYLEYHAADVGELAMPPEVFLGRRMRDLIPSETADRILAAIAAALEENLLQQVQYELPVDGVMRPYEARITPSGPDTVVAVVRNLTLLREADRARAEFEMEVVRRKAAEERAELDRRLQQVARLDSLGRLSGGVAHDVNNLLGVIGNYAAVIRRNTSDGSVLDDLAEIENAVRRGSDLTKRLLMVGRTDTKQEVSFCLADAVRSICEVLERAGNKSVPIRTELVADTLDVHMDRSQLEQAVVNLVINAQDASPENGHVVVRVTAAHSGAAAEADQHVRLEVLDRGPGIPADLRDSVLEPFVTTKGPGRGTGLGLPMVLRVATEAGGQLELEDRPGGGTRATMVIPASRGVGSDPHRGAVLVVDDDPEVLRSTAKLLAAHGMPTVTAASVPEAMKVIGSSRDLVAVLSDVVMPGLSGVDLDAGLRRSRPDLPLVFMTGFVDRSTDLPDDRAVLSKPLVVDDLIRSLGSVIAG